MSDLSNPSVIRTILSQHGFHFSKALGQNFLINPTVCPRMASMSRAGEAAGVLEIGPGIGVLTAELAKCAKKVVSIELDQRLIPVLKETLKDHDNVKVLQGDVLTADLAGIIREEFGGGEVAVCANLPYYITSPVIMRLLESRLPIRSVTVMVQKEAAARLTAKPGTRETGAVSLAVWYYSTPQILFPVPAGSFLPRPQVDSCVIRLDLHKEPPVHTCDEKLMFRLIRLAYNQRRKTILNALSSGFGKERDRLDTALQKAGIPPGQRGEKLTLEEYAQLADALKETEA